jgi:hypothetical protein
MKRPVLLIALVTLTVVGAASVAQAEPGLQSKLTAISSDSRTASGHLGPPSWEDSTPLLPSHWPRLRSEDRGDLAAHEPAMVQAMRMAPGLYLGPALTRQGLPSVRIRCWRRQADHPARTSPPAAQDGTRIDEHATDASMLPRAATRPTLLPAWQCPNRCQERDVGEVERGDRLPTRVRFAVRESELAGRGPATSRSLQPPKAKASSSSPRVPPPSTMRCRTRPLSSSAPSTSPRTTASAPSFRRPQPDGSP